MTIHRTVTAGVVLACVALATGCSNGGPKTYPVNGKVVLSGDDGSRLSGHHVEAALESDPTIRAAGIIGPDGSFTLETLQGGKVVQGAPEGTYKVRILAADEDAEGRKLKKPPVSPKHLKFETSGLSLQVPPEGDVTLRVAGR